MIWTPPSLAQPIQGYRFSTDAFLLASFASAFPSRSWCDLGTGSGVVAWELAQRLGGNGVAIEQQKILLDYARINLAGTHVTLIHGDLCRFPWRKQAFDLVVCNPPYYEVGAGGINDCPMRALARHTFFGGVCDFATYLAPALTPDGLFCFVFPFHLHQRVLTRLNKTGWFLKRRLLIRSYTGQDPKLICLALSRKGPQAIQEFDMVVYKSHRQFTPQHEWFLKTGDL